MNRNTIRVTTVGAALGVAAIFAPAAASAAPGGLGVADELRQGGDPFEPCRVGKYLPG